MSDIDEVEKFLGLYGPDYEKLLLIVRRVCTEVQEKLGLGVVDDIYSRRQSTGGSNEYKEPGAIARKVRGAGQSVGVPAILKLNDVVGLTVVVHYPDQLAAVIGEIRRSLANESCTTTEPEVHKANKGYFATHVVCSKSMTGETLRCEIQFKTMLHDAWSAKMHDLTYKPMGTLDPRLSALMASIADTIESVENQSCLVRDLIRSGWNVEGETRRAARQTVFEDVLRYHDHIMEASEKEALGTLHAELVSLYQDIESQSKILKTESLIIPMQKR
jgi:ppGpp synthetase/RelA/SpoT-type nucleotidyltranferase